MCRFSGLYRCALPPPGRRDPVFGLARKEKGRRETAFSTNASAALPQLDMIFRPALRFLTGPFPPGLFAARFLAAVIRPPLLFLVTISITPFGTR
jgi:hypothetical protein